MNRIAMLTSGGDAPGMNAVIRAVARRGHFHGLEVIGVRHGYAGLMAGEFIPLGARDVGNIIQRGGTILGSARSQAFRTPEGRAQAAAQLQAAGIEGLVVCGGDGSFRGALALLEAWDGRLAAVPATIDNDISGTDTTVGFDTAVNTALEAIDRIRDTAEAQERVFLVEVMEPHLTADLRVTVLGHIQRGGAPTAASRILGTRLGIAAVEALRDGARGLMVGVHGGEVVRVPLHEAVARQRPPDTDLVDLILSLAG
jgi:6-phosphofructokinase